MNAAGQSAQAVGDALEASHLAGAAEAPPAPKRVQRSLRVERRAITLDAWQRVKSERARHQAPTYIITAAIIAGGMFCDAPVSASSIVTPVNADAIVIPVVLLPVTGTVPSEPPAV